MVKAAPDQVRAGLSRRGRHFKEKPQTANRVIARGASWSTLSQLAPVALNLVLTPYVIHGLGLDRYGLFILVGTISGFLYSFDGGIGTTAQRFFSIYAGTDDRVATTRLLVTLCVIISTVGVCFSVFDWFIAPVVASVFHMPHSLRGEAVFLLRTLGLLVTFGFLHGLFNAVVQAHQRYGLTSRAGLVCYAGWTVGIIAVVHYHWGLRGIGVVFICQQALATLLVVPSSFAYLTRRGIGVLSWREIREFFSYSLRVQVTGLASLVNLEVDALVIGALLPVRTVGLYNTGANFAMQLRTVATNPLGPAASHLSQTFGREGLEATKAELQRLQRLWVVGTTGWCAAGIGAAYFGITAWLGPQFKLAALICMILLAGHAVNLYTGMMTVYASAIGRPGVETRYGVFSMAVNLILTVPLALTGALGVVAATTAGQVVGSVYLLRVVRKRLSPDLPNFLADIPLLRAVGTAAVTAGLEYLLRPYLPTGPLGLLACGAPALVGIALFALMTLGPRRLAFALRNRSLPL